MQLTHFNGTAFSTLGLTAELDARAPGEQSQPLWLARADAPPELAGLSRPGRTIPVLFHTTGGTARTKDEDRIVRLLGLLDPTNPTPRALRGSLILDDDNNGTPETTHTVEVDCVVGARNWDDAWTYRVVFHAAEDVWRETTDTTDGPNSITSDSSFTVDNDGEAPAYPQIRVKWTAQRNSGETAQLGWKYRVVVPVTNTSDRNWHDELIPIALGSTTALVSGAKALSSGNDVRVRCDGRDIPRQLQNWNKASEYGYLIVPLTLAAGETCDLEVVYGNPQAGDPRGEGLTLDVYTGFDLGGYAAPDLGSDSGTTTAGSTSTVLTDSGKSWVVNRWAGGTLIYTNGNYIEQRRRIVSNTATTITTERAFNGTAPGAGSTYVVLMSGFRSVGGQVSSGGAGTTFTDSSQVLNTNELVGGSVVFHSGTGSGATEYPVTANTGTVITSSATFPTLDTTSRYFVKVPLFWSWYVDQVEHSEKWRGRNRLNRHQDRPSRVWFKSDGIPGAWDRVLTLPNDDDYRQLRWTAFSDGSTNDYVGILDVRRKKGVDTDTFEEEGIADGLAYHSALGIRGVRFDYDYTNESGVGHIVMLAKPPGGESWAVVHETTTTQASPTALALTYVDLTPTEGNYPLHVTQAVWPADEVEIPDAADGNDEANVQDDETIEVLLDPSGCEIDGERLADYRINFSTDEEAIYDLQATIAYGASVAAATHLVRIGRHAELDEDEQGGWYHLADGDVLVIDCDTGEIFEYTGSITASSYTKRQVAHAAVVYERINDPDNDGSLVSRPSSRWMPLPGNATTTVQVAETGLGTLDVYLAYAEGYAV